MRSKSSGRTRVQLAVVALLAATLPAHNWTLGRSIDPPTPFVTASHRVVPVLSAPEPPAAMLAIALDGPGEAHFRQVYDSDRSNQKVQTWQEYWGWVQTFYQGNLLSEGWIRFGQVTREGVRSEQQRSAVIQRLNELGKSISQEWAKAGSIRKINTADLRQWYNAIGEARRKDDGTGAGILDALEKIRAIVETRSR